MVPPASQAPSSPRRAGMAASSGQKRLPVGRLPFLLKVMEREVGRELDRRLIETGITKAELGVLRAVIILERSSSAQVARMVFVSPQAMVGVMAQLERKQFIERQRSDASARVIEATATPAGRAAYENGMKVMAGLDQVFREEFDETEMASFLGYMERCIAVLQEPR